MNNPEQPDACPTCGGKRPLDQLRGLCPDCVVRVSLGQLLESPSNDAGARIFGDYELLEELARGGMGVVYRARQISLGRIVAVKMIRAGLMAGHEEVKRFRVEAEAAASLDHPHIVPIYEIGEHAGQQYFSMKLMEGGSLAARLAGRQGPGWSMADCARLLAQVARAVHHAHQHGILHRDLKPGNILLDALGGAHVTDFGLAKLLTGDAHHSADHQQLTLSGAILGTPAYMSPEQAAGQTRQLSTAADIYSLGAILYELLAGRPPFTAETPLATMRRLMDEEPARPSSVNGLIDHDLETICLKCLEKEPAHRYHSAEALAEDLERWLRHDPIEARVTTPAERLVKWVRRHPARAGAVVTFLVLLIIGVAGVFWQWRRAEQALQESQESLWRADFDRAHALRTSRQMGQRVGALQAIRAAAKIRPTPELRNEAIAAMALVDLEDVGIHLTRGTDSGFSVDGRFEYAAAGLPGNIIRVEELGSRRFLAQWTNLIAPKLLWFSTDGKRLVAGDAMQDRLQVWDWRRTNLLFSGGLLQFGGLSPDGKFAARPVPPGSCGWFDLESGAEAGRVPWQGIREDAFSFAPRGGLFAIGNDAVNQIWRMADSACIATNPTPPGSWSLAWSPTEPLVAIGNGRNEDLTIWNVVDSRQKKLIGHLREGTWADWHAGGGLLVSTCWDQVMRLWDPYSGVQLLEAKSVVPVRPKAFSPDGQWLQAIRAHDLVRFRVHAAPECRVFHLPAGVEQGLRNVEFSPDDRFLAGVSISAGGQGIWTWDVATGRRIAHQWLDHPNGMRFADGGTLLTSSLDGMVLWTNARPGTSWLPERQAILVPGEDRDFGGFALSTDRNQIVVRRDLTNELFDYPSLRRRLTLEGQHLAELAEFSPDGRWLASGYWDNTGTHRSEFWIWSAEDGRPLRKIASGNCQPHFSPDGRWLVVAGETEYSQYEMKGDPSQWRLVRQFERDTTSITAGFAAFSDDGRILALQLDDRVVALVEAATGRELARLTPPPHVVTSSFMTFSHNGRRLAVVSEQGVHVWDLQLIRSELREMNLDWDGPPDLPVNPAPPAPVDIPDAYDALARLPALAVPTAVPPEVSAGGKP